MIKQVDMGCYTAFLTATKSNNNEIIVTVNGVDWVTVTGYTSRSISLDIDEFKTLYELLTEVNKFINSKLT